LSNQFVAGATVIFGGNRRRQSTKTIRKLIAVIATCVSLCLLRSCCPRQTEEENSMAATLNRRAYEHAKELITEGRFIFDERDAWSEHRPSAEEENEFIRLHSFAEYGEWYLGLNDEKPEADRLADPSGCAWERLSTSTIQRRILAAARKDTPTILRWRRTAASNRKPSSISAGGDPRQAWSR
jgi:hypothetical protein